MLCLIGHFECSLNNKNWRTRRLIRLEQMKTDPNDNNNNNNNDNCSTTFCIIIYSLVISLFIIMILSDDLASKIFTLNSLSIAIESSSEQPVWLNCLGIFIFSPMRVFLIWFPWCDAMYLFASKNSAKQSVRQFTFIFAKNSPTKKNKTLNHIRTCVSLQTEQTQIDCPVKESLIVF